MKIKRFRADAVRGYLDFKIEFNDDLTFLIGLNGSGKTTALDLIAALVTPSIRSLIEIPFKTCVLDTQTADGAGFTIEASHSEGSLRLSATGVTAPLMLQLGALESLPPPFSSERAELLQNLETAAIKDDVYQTIVKMPNPMFLALDRRARSSDEAISDERRRILLGHGPRTRPKTGGIVEVDELVRDTVSRVRTEQEKLDSELRKKIILDSFSYSLGHGVEIRMPDPATVIKYRAKVAQIERAVDTLGVPVAEVQARLKSFFDRLEALGQEIDASRSASSKKSGKQKDESYKIIEWVMNQSQVDRILNLFESIEQYMAKRDSTYRPISSLLELVNRFLSQTGKKAAIEGSSLVVEISGELRGLHALSSGERQIVTMLAQLSLNKAVSNAGVFIVDEPELSLHIAWQEMFVDAIREASPKTQIILATHSPSIILDRDEFCVDLTQGG